MKNKERKPVPPPLKRQVKVIVLILLTVSVVVFMLGYLQSQVMSGITAYIRGEGLWAKSQKEAVIQLYEYIHHPDDRTFQDFNRSLQINLEDQRARLALQQNTPDFRSAREGFIAAKNHPDDVDNMMRLFLMSGRVQHMKRAIEIWTEADRHIAELIDLANRIRNHHKALPLSDLTQFKPELDRLNAKLNELEIAFSLELSQGSRWMTRTFLIVNILLLFSMLAAATWVARRTIVQIDATESELRHSESRFKTLYDSNIIGILIWGKDGELYDANDAFLSILGYTRAELDSGQLNWRELTPPDHSDLDDKAMQQITTVGHCTPFNKDFIHKAGHRVPVFLGGALMDGSHDLGVAFMVDRTNIKKMEDQLRLSATVLEASRDGILICDHNRKVLTVNDAYCYMSGYPSKAIIGETAHFYHSANAEESKKIEESLKTHGYWQEDSELLTSAGAKLPVRASISAVYGKGNETRHYVAVFADISERKALERNLKNMAHYDHLTGLANRSLFSDRLDTAIARAQRSRKDCALLFVDLDKFKPVNDQYGHAIGDEILQEVASRLKSVTRDADTLSRLGGDEFVIIVEGLTEDSIVTHIAEKVAHQLSQPFNVGRNSITIGCSIGIAIYPQHGCTGIELTRAADIAMYAAKAADDTHYYLYQKKPKSDANHL
ncbi:MAG: diguanylate cyclase [Ketobacter sp.]|nr:diguanylate cyclase [Ketobacter sp.]